MIEPLVFDVSGVDGTSGISGVSYGSVASRGRDGLWGGHGIDGHCGTSAGTISMQLSTPTTTSIIAKKVVLANPIDVDVKLDASIVKSSGELQKMDTLLNIKSGQTMCFIALGGHGGNGGHGGHGQDGGKGYRHGTFLVLSFNKISEYALRTGDWMQLVPVT